MMRLGCSFPRVEPHALRTSSDEPAPDSLVSRRLPHRAGHLASPSGELPADSLLCTADELPLLEPEPALWFVEPSAWE